MARCPGSPSRSAAQTMGARKAGTGWKGRPAERQVLPTVVRRRGANIGSKGSRFSCGLHVSLPELVKDQRRRCTGRGGEKSGAAPPFVKGPRYAAVGPVHFAPAPLDLWFATLTSMLGRRIVLDIDDHRWVLHRRQQTMMDASAGRIEQWIVAMSS